jgi:short subunit dehydrogenase-like uncharacterized protein
MALLSGQRGPIALFGATGYTGRLVAAELAAAEADFVLSGRSRAKLEALAEELGRRAPVQPARLEDPGSIRALLSDCAVVIDCAGPFARYGEPVLRAAVETGTHYLDTTGEQSYMKMAFERYGTQAEQAGMAVIPAVGYDYVPGDMIASVTAEGMGELDEVLLAYAWLGFRPSRGTMQTALEILRGGGSEWRNLQWVPARGSWGAGTFEFPSPVGRRRMMRYPSGEQITVPRHVATRNVHTIYTAETFAPHRRLAGMVPLVARPTGATMRTPLRRAADALLSRLPEGPSEEERRKTTYTIVCEARSEHRMRRGEVRGTDTYGVTAAAIAKGALIAAGRRFSASGALAPSQAFDPRKFLDGLDRFLSWEVGEPVEPAAGVPA